MKRKLSRIICFVFLFFVFVGCQGDTKASKEKLDTIRTTVYEQLEKGIQLDIEGDWQAAKVELKPTQEFRNDFFTLDESYAENEVYVVTFKSKNLMMGDYIRLADSAGKIVGYNHRL